MCNTNLCPNELGEDILFIGSAPRPQALILLKIAAASRTCGLDLCSERRFSFCFAYFYLLCATLKTRAVITYSVPSLHPKACTFKQLSLSYLLFLFPHHPYSAMTRFHVQHKSVFSANELSQDILFIGSAPRPSGSHPTENYSCRRDLLAGFVLWEAFFILFCLFSFYHVPR